MNVERRRLLESFGGGPAMLAAALHRFPRKMWVYRPSANCASIHETIWQLADSEVVEYFHCRGLITNLDSSAVEVDSSRWRNSFGYFHQDVKEAMRIIRAFRRVTYHLLKMLPEISWTNRVELPPHGQLSLNEWLEIREKCLPQHIEQMEWIYSEWIESEDVAKKVTSMRKLVSARNSAPKRRARLQAV